jgi:hypothetical protein
MNECVPQELVTISFDDGWSAQKYRTFGLPLLNIDKDVYSNALKGLLFQCLSWDPKLRPAAKDIIEATERALSIFEDPDTKQPDIERALTRDRKLSRIPELLTKLDTPGKGRRRYVDESVASTRSRFQDLSLGLGVGDEGVAAGGDEVEPGRPTWRVHAFEPLLPSPLTAAEQGAKDQAEYEEMLAGFTREASEV